MLGVAVKSAALCDSYAPFPAGKRPLPFAVTVYRKLDVPLEGAVRFSRPDGTPSPLCVTQTEAGFRFGLGEIAEKPGYTITAPGAMVGAVSAGEADLNHDGKPDYIIITYSGGCGLAAQASWATFILSSSTSYCGQILPGYDAALRDLVDIDNDGRPEYLHEFFVQSVGEDGRPHSYWVFNLVGFEGSNLVSANNRASDFPRWVWYTIRDNHRAVTQFTVDQKRRIWTEAMSDERTHWLRSDFSLLRQLTPTN